VISQRDSKNFIWCGGYGCWQHTYFRKVDEDEGNYYFECEDHGHKKVIPKRKHGEEKCKQEISVPA